VVEKRSIDFDVISSFFLHLLDEVSPFNSILFGKFTEGFLDTFFHTLESTHVNVGVRLLHLVPEFLSIFGHFSLDVHFVSGFIGLLSANGVVVFEFISCDFLHLFELSIV